MVSERTVKIKQKEDVKKTSNQAVQEISEADEEMFSQEDFQDALKKASQRICEPDQETEET